MTEKRYAIAIHGGAGTILKSTMTPEKEAAYNDPEGSEEAPTSDPPSETPSADPPAPDPSKDQG